jgi:hypothetical protein
MTDTIANKVMKTAMVLLSVSVVDLYIFLCKTFHSASKSLTGSTSSSADTTLDLAVLNIP